jgi:hypothetical protein
MRERDEGIDASGTCLAPKTSCLSLKSRAPRRSLRLFLLEAALRGPGYEGEGRGNRCERYLPGTEDLMPLPQIQGSSAQPQAVKADNRDQII